MARFSSKMSLLSGVSAVVLATTVGVSAVGVSGALAQAGRDYTLESGEFDINAYSGADARNIRILQSGTGGAGVFRVFSDGPVTQSTIEKIVKQGKEAITLSLTSLSNGTSILFIVTSSGDIGGLSHLTFNGDLTIEGRMQIEATGSDSASFASVAKLELKGAQNRFADDIRLRDETSSRSKASIVLSGGIDQTIGRVNDTGDHKIRAAYDGEGTIEVLNGVDGQAPHKATFDIQLGHDDATDENDRRLRQLTVGDASKGGHAIFNRGVHVDNIDVIAGNSPVEYAIAEFRSDVSGTGARLAPVVHLHRQFLLHIKAQAFFATSDEAVQGAPQRPEKTVCFFKFTDFGLGKNPFF